MKSIIEITNEIRARADKIKAIEAETEARAELYTLEAFKAAKDGNAKIAAELEAARKADKEAAEMIRTLRIECAILKDNRRQAVFAAAAPAVAAVLKKYNGKPYGEKTREKISEEVKAACGCRCRVDTYGWSGCQIVLNPAAANGWNDPQYSYRDFEIYAKTEDGKQHLFVDANNKIHAVEADKLYLSGCRPYCEDIAARAAELIEKAAELEAIRTAEREKAAELNEIMPSGYDHTYSTVNGVRF